jgi:hypothetical protein
MGSVAGSPTGFSRASAGSLPQISRLRGVTTCAGRIPNSLAGPLFGGEAHSRSLHFAAPDFLLSSVALASLMRLSLKKTAYVAVGECRVAGIRVRFGRDDKSKGNASIESLAKSGEKPRFVAAVRSSPCFLRRMGHPSIWWQLAL